jgi:hypothetical protein
VVQIGKSCLNAKGIGREDRDARDLNYAEMYTLFGASAMLLFMLDIQLELSYGMMDIGIFMTGVCLLAKEKGSVPWSFQP